MHHKKRDSKVFGDSNVEVHEERVIQSVEFFTDTLAHDADLTVLSVVLNAVLEDEVHIVEEVLQLEVLIRVQFLLDEAKVHWLLNDVKIVGDVQLLRVDRLVEDPRLIMLPQGVYHALSGFVPAIVDLSMIRHIRDRKILYRSLWLCHPDCLLILKVFSELGIFNAKLGPFLVIQRLILTILKNGQLVSFRNFSFINLLLLRLSSSGQPLIRLLLVLDAARTAL